MSRYGPRHKFDNESLQELINRYEAGEGLNELAGEYHHSRDIIRRILEANDVPLRARGLSHPTINTPIELRLHDVLRKVGIGFDTHRRLVRRYVVDIVIDQKPVIIEADGWQHQEPEHRKHDEIRDDLHREAGFRVFRFTGNQINSNAEKCIQEVINACGLAPDKKPVFSIRTGFTGENHPRWQGGLREFTCATCEKIFLAQPAHRPGNKAYCSRKCANGNGRKLTDEHKEAIGNGIRGKKRKSPPPFSDEHLANLSAALKGKKKTPEHVAKVIEANRRRRQIKIESELT